MDEAEEEAALGRRVASLRGSRNGGEASEYIAQRGLAQNQGRALIVALLVKFYGLETVLGGSEEQFKLPDLAKGEEAQQKLLVLLVSENLRPGQKS